MVRIGNVGRKKVGMKKDMSSAVVRLKKGGKVKRKNLKRKVALRQLILLYTLE